MNDDLSLGVNSAFGKYIDCLLTGTETKMQITCQMRQAIDN